MNVNFRCMGGRVHACVVGVCTADDVSTTNDTTTGGAALVAVAASGGGGAAAASNTRRMLNQIPRDILEDEELNKAIAQLPANYNLEIHKTIWKVRQAEAKRVALQFPEGLLMYACVVADIVEHFTGAETLILGDVTYGACCVDDLGAKALGADFMVHYGHSCLVPIDVTTVKMLYVFVDIGFDTEHLVASVKANFGPTTKLALLGTIQFASGLHTARLALSDCFPDLYVPQIKPLSPGEVLGCTSPNLAGRDAYVFVADGRFHLESAMIANPTIPAFRYNPYDKKLTSEGYDTERMRSIRKSAIDAAAGARTFGVILGTLGRQGNPIVLERLEAHFKARGKQYIIVLLSEIFPVKLALLSKSVDAWVQIACPRLSIDWGASFEKPLLSAYEAHVALDAAAWTEVYPMDFYAAGSGPWTNYHKTAEDVERAARAAAARRAQREAARTAAGKAPAPTHITVTYDNELVRDSTIA